MPLDTLTDQPRVSAPDPTGNTEPSVTGLAAAQRLAEITGIGPVRLRSSSPRSDWT